MKAKAIGYEGEKLAADYLQSKGYEIIEMNFTVQGGEIDIVARHKEMLVFVEVKTRSSDFFGNGEESVDRDKYRLLQKAVQKYLTTRVRNEPDHDYRIDIIEIELDQKMHLLKNIQHYEDIEL